MHSPAWSLPIHPHISGSCLCVFFINGRQRLFSKPLALNPAWQIKATQKQRASVYEK